MMADFLLRFDRSQWALVTARPRKNWCSASAPEQARPLGGRRDETHASRRLGEGGGHRTKAGGYISLDRIPPLDVAKLRKRIWKRFLCAVGLKPGKPTKLVP